MIKEIFEENLKARNSFGVDTTAARIVEFDAEDELCDYLARHKDVIGKIAVIGGGNNILFTDRFDGTLLHPVNESLEITEDNATSATVRAGAGLDWDCFVDKCVSMGLWGAENLASIPGTVGAAPVQNIGAYGAEAKDIILSVECLDLSTLKKSIISGGHCGFGYRDSIFKRELKGRIIITAVNFRLSKTPCPNLGYGALAQVVEQLGGATLSNIRDGVTKIRGEKLPDPAVLGNAGSFFKNPLVAADLAEELKYTYPDMPSFHATEGSVKIPAGWLIEQSGWKGSSLGKAGVYEKQALILVNLGGATGQDIINLSDRVIEEVYKKFGIRIEPEVNIW